MASLLVCTESSICFLAACSEAGIVCHTHLSRTNFPSEQPRDEDEDEVREQMAPLSRGCALCCASSQPLAVTPVLTPEKGFVLNPGVHYSQRSLSLH